MRKIKLLFLLPILFWASRRFKHINKLRIKNIEKFKKKWPLEKRYALVAKYCRKFRRAFKGRHQIIGTDNVPKDGGAVIVCNHQSNADPQFMIAATPRPVRFIAKKEIQKFPVFGAGGDVCDMIWIERGNTSQTVTVFREALKTTKQGRILMVYPEGTRSKSQEMLEFKVDTIKLVMMTKSPIVPAKFTNAYKALNKNDKLKRKDVIKLEFLKPIPYELYRQYTPEQMTEILHKIIEAA